MPKAKNYQRNKKALFLSKLMPKKNNHKTYPNVNGLIFRELIKRGYSLDGKTRIWNIADSKLWYLTPEQSQAYLDAEESRSFQKLASTVEFQLIKDNIKEIKFEIGPGSINLVDLGCGDGHKAVQIIKEISNQNRIKYCPIDISSYMVRKAVGNISKLKEVDGIIESRWNISDFENLENVTSLLEDKEFSKSLFIILGYTLGNFEINDLLYQIRVSMKPGDVLLLVTGIANEHWGEWTKSAENNTKLNNFFKHTLLLLGLSEKDLQFGARLQNNRVEYYYTILEDKKINFQGREVNFNKGDQIVVAVSYKHKKDDFMTYLNMHFDKVQVKISKDGATALALCKK